MITAYFVNQTEQDLSNLEPTAMDLINKTIQHLNIQNNYEITYIYVRNDEIQSLNATYRNKDYVTDVLTFPGEESYLGDVFICIDQVALQAPELDNTFEEEMRFMYVHGLLHALGYDHETNAEDEKEMLDLQNTILEME